MPRLTVSKLKALLGKLDGQYTVHPTESGIVFLGPDHRPKSVIDITGRMLAFGDQNRDGLQLRDEVSVVKRDDPNPIVGNISE